MTMTRLIAALKALVRSERAASLVEYALTLLLIAIVTLVAIAALGDRISAFFSSASTTI
jgi:Flp pilus assembly pilin Flp